MDGRTCRVWSGATRLTTCQLLLAWHHGSRSASDRSYLASAAWSVSRTILLYEPFLKPALVSCVLIDPRQFDPDLPFIFIRSRIRILFCYTTVPRKVQIRGIKSRSGKITRFWQGCGSYSARVKFKKKHKKELKRLTMVI